MGVFSRSVSKQMDHRVIAREPIPTLSKIKRQHIKPPLKSSCKVRANMAIRPCLLVKNRAKHRPAEPTKEDRTAP